MNRRVGSLELTALVNINKGPKGFFSVKVFQPLLSRWIGLDSFLYDI